MAGENASQDLPTPRLFQITIKGRRYNSTSLCDVFSILQLGIDPADIDNAIELFKEDFEKVESVEWAELTIGYSPLFHEVFIEGCQAMQITL